MSVVLLRGNALSLPLADACVDLIVTSPPYWALRSYSDGGEHYPGQIGSEYRPSDFLDALIASTREMMRVLKPSGSIWVNLGDKYARNGGGSPGSSDSATGRHPRPRSNSGGYPEKSLIGLPWRYAIRCIDELGLILRAEVIWSKTNPLPESVADRVRRSHETWFHFTIQPTYYSAVDEIREPQAQATAARYRQGYGDRSKRNDARLNVGLDLGGDQWEQNPIGKLPGSVWSIPTQALLVPDTIGVDHFAAFPMEWPRRLIRGWSPQSYCVTCDQPRLPIIERGHSDWPARRAAGEPLRHGMNGVAGSHAGDFRPSRAEVTGYSCGCLDVTAPTRPSVVLDPFGGTGTTAMVADVLGRIGISVDMSADYTRLASWRTTDPGERAKAALQPRPEPVSPDQHAFDL